jgi:hypothetical protein
MPQDAGSARPTETRKLAAIMFTDIVGFSRQMGADEARMLRLLNIMAWSLNPLGTASSKKLPQPVLRITLSNTSLSSRENHGNSGNSVTGISATHRTCTWSRSRRSYAEH